MAIRPEGEEPGAAFDDADVARCYALRPPYAPALFDVLAALPARRRRALDLGCGPGKVAASLAERFETVVALDPAGPMIAEGRARFGARLSNIAWVQAPAEAPGVDGPFDLVTAGTSIHLMDHARLFPWLAERTVLVAVISGDEPPAPPWREGWREAMVRWLARVGRTYDPAGFAAMGRAHEPWMDIAGRRSFPFVFEQAVEDYVACQHSRGAWTRAKMGPDLAAEFDRDLEALLRPYASGGLLRFELVSELSWGAPRRTPRG